MKQGRTQVKRVPQRASYDKDKAYDIIDQGFICHIAFKTDDTVNIIPTIHWRIDDNLYIHGATKSRLIQAVQENTVSIGITHLDGLVLARSAFHHSMNYRSVVIYSQGKLVSDHQKKLDLSQFFMEKIIPGRWNEIRQPNIQELKATAFIEFPINEFSAKIRTGGPVDDEEDLKLGIWAGHIPLQTIALPPVSAKDVNTNIPSYAYSWLKK